MPQISQVQLVDEGEFRTINSNGGCDRAPALGPETGALSGFLRHGDRRV